MSGCIPNIAGVWKYKIVDFKRKDPTVKPSFSDIQTIETEVTVEQSGNFVIVTFPVSPVRPKPGYKIGVLIKVYTKKESFWQLTLPDYNDDGFNTFTIKQSKNGKPCVLAGNYVEAGFSSTNPSQVQTVSSVTMTKIK